MTKYAYFDPSSNIVLQLIDTGANEYNLPDSTTLHECTDAEWELLNSIIEDTQEFKITGDLVSVATKINTAEKLAALAAALQISADKIAAYYTDMQAAELSDDAATLANTKAAAKPWIAYRKTLLALRNDPQWPTVAIPEAPQ